MAHVNDQEQKRVTDPIIRDFFRQAALEVERAADAEEVRRKRRQERASETRKDDYDWSMGF